MWQEAALRHQVSLEKKLKKLVLVLATFTPVTETRKETVETIKTAKTAKVVKIARGAEDGKESEGGWNPRSNFSQVLCIRYSINFKKKSVWALFDSDNQVNVIQPIFT